MLLKEEKQKMKEEFKANLNNLTKEELHLKYKLFYYQSNKNIIELRNVNKYFLNQDKYELVLNDISIAIPKGKIIIVLGPSGSGKTTLFNLMSGLIKNELGEVNIVNRNLTHLNEKERNDFRRKYVSFVFQSYNLMPTLNNRDNILLGKDMNNNNDALNIDDISNKLGITKILDKFPNQVSGGQKQRVAIARALIKNPKIIFADEPTGALDSTSAKEVLKQFIKINKDYKTTILLITHNPKISYVGDYILKIKNGVLEDFYENETKIDIDQFDT